MLAVARRLLMVAALTSAVIVTAPQFAHAQAVDAEAQSQLRFTRGRDLFVARNFEAALVEFRAAFSLVRSPNIRLYVARSLRELGRYAEAYVEFQRSAAEAADRASTEPRFAGTRDTARNEGNEIQNRIGRITVHVPHPPEGVAVTVGGAPLGSAGWELPTPVNAQDVVVTATAPGRLPYRQVVPVRAGETAEVSVELAVDPNAARTAATRTPGATAPVTTRTMEGGGVRTLGIAAVVLGVLGGAGTGIFGYLAQKQYSDLQMMCGADLCGPEYDMQISTGQQYVLLSNVSLGVGIGALAIGLIMVAAGGPHEVVHTANRPAASLEQHRRPAPRWNVWGGPNGNGGGAAGLTATF